MNDMNTKNIAVVALSASAFVLIPVLSSYASRRDPIKGDRGGKQESCDVHGYLKENEPPCLQSSSVENIKIITSNRFPSAMLEWSREYGDIFQLQLPIMTQPRFIITGNVDLCRQVLNDKTSVKTDLYNVYKLVHDGGDDILTSENAFWKHSRKGIAPAFSSNHIKRMNEVIDRKIDDFTMKLETFAENEESFDVGVEMIHLTLSIICDSAFQYSMTLEERNMFLTELEIVLREVELGWIPYRWTFGLFIPAVRRARKAGRILLAFSMKILESYRQLESPVKGTVVDLIANNKGYKNDKERASDILMLLVGGHDSTAFTLAWTLMELAKNKEEQNKLQKELNSIDVDKRRSSVGLNCVIKEAMRLRTVAPLGSPREVARDILFNTEERNGLKREIFIPKGSLVLCSQILLNRNPKYHEDPDIFKPSRWVEPSEHALASFMPFSLGRRNCVGQSLAKAELVNVLSRLCAKYTFSIEDEGGVDLVLTHQPVGARLSVSKAV
eukprot:CAMPEP_0203679336 /NCGR_PEP_ID=MMETSP0090-20130426/35292_1 /ASSEMBLY_ACC=CAM_ASM_001088 /TAXON_ID=426623 /ORGANISM="Chaetoceros affinis, Strain CCMP159" /LENGTH=498 /DNA_ID=CAMNT_0050546947 /DNA_START=33 /DNA_END=1529 /DNA_ORIENTATION=-